MRRGSKIAKKKEAMFNPEIVETCLTELRNGKDSLRQEMEKLIEAYNKAESLVDDLSPADKPTLKKNSAELAELIDSMHKKVIGLKSTFETMIPTSKKLKVQSLG